MGAAKSTNIKMNLTTIGQQRTLDVMHRQTPRRQRPGGLLVLAACAVLLTLAGACATSGVSFSPGELDPLVQLRPVSDDVVRRAVAAEPRDATLVELEQAFSLLRRARSDDDVVRARAMLEQAFTSFEDLRDPENMSVAFTPDRNTPYRGRPHERVLAATTLALTDAVNGRCDLALPTLKAAEFLDVRWQRLAFGTDAAAVYALSVYCLAETNGRPEDVRRAEEGLRLTYRYAAAEAAARALVDEALVHAPRRHAVATMVGGELFKLGLLTTLANNPRATRVDEVLAGGADAVAVVMRRADEFMALPEFADALRVATEAAGGTFADNTTARQFVRAHIADAVKEIAGIVAHLPDTVEAKRSFTEALTTSTARADESLRQLRTARVQLRFSGLGPMVVREGDYLEVARLVPRDGAHSTTALRLSTVDASTATCGIRGERDGAGFVATLCGNTGSRAPAALASSTEAVAALEVWSSSVQATTVVGRRFDAILQGRAMFKASSAVVSTLATWSARGLLETGFTMLASCGGRSASSPSSSSSAAAAPSSRQKGKAKAKQQASQGNGDEACVGVAMATITVGAVVAGVGGVAWLAGSVVNAEADPRFVNALPERIELLLPTSAPVVETEAPTPAAEQP